MNRSKAIIFDLDDTLYPERDYVLSGFRAVAKWTSQHLGTDADQTWQQLVQLFEDGLHGNTFDVWLESASVDKSANTIDQMVQVYRRHTPQLTKDSVMIGTTL